MHGWSVSLVLYVWVAMCRRVTAIGEHAGTLRPSSYRCNDQGSTRLETSGVVILVLKPILSFDFQFQGRETDQAGL